jgi:hypothetical protein
MIMIALKIIRSPKQNYSVVEFLQLEKKGRSYPPSHCSKLKSIHHDLRRKVKIDEGMIGGATDDGRM